MTAEKSCYESEYRVPLKHRFAVWLREIAGVLQPFPLAPGRVFWVSCPIRMTAQRETHPSLPVAMAVSFRMVQPYIRLMLRSYLDHSSLIEDFSGQGGSSPAGSKQASMCPQGLQAGFFLPFRPGLSLTPRPHHNCRDRRSSIFCTCRLEFRIHTSALRYVLHRNPHLTTAMLGFDCPIERLALPIQEKDSKNDYFKVLLSIIPEKVSYAHFTGSGFWF